MLCLATWSIENIIFVVCPVTVLTMTIYEGILWFSAFLYCTELIIFQAFQIHQLCSNVNPLSLPYYMQNIATGMIGSFSYHAPSSPSHRHSLTIYFEVPFKLFLIHLDLCKLHNSKNIVLFCSLLHLNYHNKAQHKIKFTSEKN